MAASKNRKRELLLLVLGLCFMVLMPRAPLVLSVQTRWAEPKKILPPLARPADPKEHVFIPLENYSGKLSALFDGEDVVFIRAGVGVGKSTLGCHLGRQYPKMFVNVPFGDYEYASWSKNIIEAIEIATGMEVKESDTQLEDALRLLKAENLILVLDEAHTIFNLPRICTLLFKSYIHPKVLLFSASGEANASSPTTPTEIRKKFFWTPPVPEVGDDFINQLKDAGVRLGKKSVDFFLKFCGGHRSIFIAAMKWVKGTQNGAEWEYNETVTKVRDSMDANNWLAPGSILEGLAQSRGVKVNGRFSDLEMLPMDFIEILCEGPRQLRSAEQRWELTIHGFVVPVPEATDKEFRKVDWTQTNARYAVSNPILASYYRDQLEKFQGLKVRVDPFLPVSCMDLLLRAIPYLTFAQVVGYSPSTASSSALSASNLPFEVQYNQAIIDALRSFGYTADSSEDPVVGKADVFVNINDMTFSMEGVMAERPPSIHKEHRDRFDKQKLHKLCAYQSKSNADHKALVTIGREDDVRSRVLSTRADGVEIIGLVPNVAHTRYRIYYRGAQAAKGADLVEYDVDCDLVARALDVKGTRCIQKVSQINAPAKPSGATTQTTQTTATPQTKAVWVRRLQKKDGTDGYKLVGNAFQIDPAPSNIDYLKKAIKKEEELSIATSKIKIFQSFSQQDADWKAEERMSASLRETDEDRPYGFIAE